MTFTMNANGDPPRFTRNWFGDIFFACWGLLYVVSFTCVILGWNRGGLLYWLIFGPLLAGFVAAGIPWLALVARDLVRSPGQVWKEARPWLLGCVVVAVLAFGAQAVLA
jgi:hypothetical protein